jgi:hypothetical protein
MKKVLLLLGISLTLLLSLVPAASATQAPAAKKADVPAVATAAALSQAWIVGFEHSNYGGSVVLQKKMIYTCSAGSSTQIWPLYDPARWKISSIKLTDAIGWGCNQIGVQARYTGEWSWQCTRRTNNVIPWFGPGYNDTISNYGVRYNGACFPY